MGIGFFVVIFTVSIGLVLGLLAGSLGGWVDGVIMRLMDIFMSLPSILFAIVIVAILGPNLINTILAVGIVSLPNVVRIVRASILVEKKKTYVQAAQSYGASWFRIYVINVLPNCIAPLLIQASFGFSDGILNAASLGFLGLGAQAPTPEWGTMLSDSRAYIESASWLVTLPGLCILIVVIAFNLLGDGLRDALDPKSKKN
jgi:ABC-type dipeptide/oligopeptide/nickel transport system permease subunit